MGKKHRLYLPDELEGFRIDIEKTVKPYVQIKAEKGVTKIYQSKFGGYPYLPKTMEYPKGANGKPMKLLAQLNFEEIPQLELMPERGILQFFISAEVEVMGIEFEDLTDPKNFRILYHQHTLNEEALITDFSILESLETDFFPIENELALTFDIDYEPVSLVDFRCYELLDDSVNRFQQIDKDNDIEIWDVYDSYYGEGHKIGGYPYFTQTDPREHETQLQEHTILLLQIDTDDDAGIMWGDSGVANFFIRKDNLERLDFSNVLYNWDCH
ncbi:YwqG family protein [Cytobacillus sp. IB215665]|uniref:YwqG family protein n=1 Tax=Cytobacillus sp. IB215665 TaxID=3097357 RepID=UPI002A10299D|nr:YwqG family protein [Cytobacillus sp. IB215665]MDX8366556.1 YwqG family protein [Cytobacillus sp. IB215665]